MKCLLSLSLILVAGLAGPGRAQGQNPARDAGYLYLSPVPTAPFVSPQTRYVLVRLSEVAPKEVTNLTTTFISVTGADSGLHPGVTHLAGDGRTVVFAMSTDFDPDELVTVTLAPQRAAGAGGTLEPYEYQFMITAPFPDVLPPGMLSSSAPSGQPVNLQPFSEPDPGPEPGGGGLTTGSMGIRPNGVSVPSDFPKITLTINNNPAPGYLFLENGFPSGAPPYTMILDNNGWPVWYKRGRVWDFKIQEDGSITWCVDRSAGFLSFDQNFSFQRVYRAENGYVTDYHELEVLADGTYLMLGNRTNRVDLSRYVAGGGIANVIEGVIQEFTPAGELIFQWRAWDHYDIRDNSGYDFPHMNALDIDTDGNILLCSRHMSEITKIHRDTGEILWRLGGLKSSFTFENDPLMGGVGQHDVNALGNGHYTMFANLGGDWSQISRAVEYELDLTSMVATAVWEFRDTPDKFTHWMGNAQRLSNGNTLINFVRSYYPPVIEVDSNGVKQLEMNLAPNTDHYRVFRFPWNGAVAAPYLLLEPQLDNVALLFNKFGDPAVDHYRIYGGTQSGATTLLATSTATLLHLTNVVHGVRNYFRVTAVSTNGMESDPSNEESLIVNIHRPGENMVLNGDFSLGTNGWVWLVTPPASATWTVAEGRSQFQIGSGGTYLTDIQLAQAGLSLTQGKEYFLEFDAWAPAPRVLEVKVEANAQSGSNYSGTQPLTITPLTNHYFFEFTMGYSSDRNARLVINAGAIPFDVYLDNIALREHVYAISDLNQDDCIGYRDLQILTSQWLQSQGPRTADFNQDGRVNFSDFVRFSEAWPGGRLCP